MLHAVKVKRIGDNQARAESELERVQCKVGSLDVAWIGEACTCLSPLEID